MIAADPQAWLPSGKQAAVVFTIDDIHPGKSTDAYEAGGDLEKGALGHVQWLLERHPELKVTLFTTADWREISPVPTRKLLAQIPAIRDRCYLTPILPKGTHRLDRHPEFCDFLRSLPRTELGLHGLYHVHKGLRVPVEFQDESVEVARAVLAESMAVFEEAKLPIVKGMTPPAWDIPPNYAQAMIDLGLKFVASARDIFVPITPDAMNQMSGLRGVSIMRPQPVFDKKLLHIPTNFQATSPIERAVDIIECGGLLSIKAHIIKNAKGFVMADAMDGTYRNYLDLLFGRLEERYGDRLWWTSMGEISQTYA